MSSPGSHRTSSSDDYSSQDSTSSSSSTGYSSPDSVPRPNPNPSVPEPEPVNQMPGQVFAESDEPVNVEPAPYDPKAESWVQWEERLETSGYSPLPTFYVTDIYPHVSKITLNKARRNLPEGYVLEYDENWPNIIEPHLEDRIGFHITSLEGGIVFPLRPLLVELCHCLRILPGQITPNAHRLLNSFVNISHHLRIDPSLRLFLYAFEVRPGKPGCEGFLYFKGRNNRKFISDLPQSNRLWKEKFVFIRFPPSVTPLAGLRWSENLLKQEYTEPVSTPDLEESLEKLLKGDPLTGQKYHYGSWVWRVQPGGEDMNFRPFSILKKTGASYSAGPLTSSAKTVLVQQETVEIIDEEETPQTGKVPMNPPPNKGKTRTKKVATSHPNAKKRRGESGPAIESLGELWVKMGLKLKELDEMANLSAIAGRTNAEILQLKEENTQLMGEISQLKEGAELKEREFPGRARQWMEENIVEVVHVLTSSEERTMEGFKLLYREEHGKEMITQIGS
ncbi:unnamed protein product [Cuscuta campestris]|uniref:Transposase (putative) gypsy type domain-containing protein n=1 Tax=Cuscuta campestris TaxID=132261 RepID=A0A484N4S9_9ASTE|nr:unnamed protein product [Cuscuta campestris]